jgi:hypothetical protein
MITWLAATRPPSAHSQPCRSARSPRRFASWRSSQQRTSRRRPSPLPAGTFRRRCSRARPPRARRPRKPPSHGRGRSRRRGGSRCAARSASGASIARSCGESLARGTTATGTSSALRTRSTSNGKVERGSRGMTFYRGRGAGSPVASRHCTLHQSRDDTTVHIWKEKRNKKRLTAMVLWARWRHLPSRMGNTCVLCVGGTAHICCYKPVIYLSICSHSVLPVDKR